MTNLIKSIVQDPPKNISREITVFLKLNCGHHIHAWNLAVRLGSRALKLGDTHSRIPSLLCIQILYFTMFAGFIRIASKISWGTASDSPPGVSVVHDDGWMCEIYRLGPNVFQPIVRDWKCTLIRESRRTWDNQRDYVQQEQRLGMVRGVGTVLLLLVFLFYVRLSNCDRLLYNPYLETTANKSSNVHE